MQPIFSAPRFGRGLALGLLLAAVAGPAAALAEPAARDAGARRLELIPAVRATDLPPELRPEPTAGSASAELGLAGPGASRKVRLHWTVRGNQPLSGYRVTLVSEHGLPGNLAARWLVPTTDGTPEAGGLTSYSAEISLSLTAPEPLAAAIEAIATDGSAVLLGVRRTVAAPEPVPARLSAVPSPAVRSMSAALDRAGATPSVKLRSAGQLAPQPKELFLAAVSDAAVRRSTLRGPASPRGPPEAGLTTS